MTLFPMPGGPISILPSPSVSQCRRAVAVSIVALSALLSLPITTSAATVYINAPNNISTSINANPNGTVFILSAGIWYRQQFTPKPGNQFIGDPAGGTILTGENVTSYVYASNGTVNLGVLFKNIVVEHYGINAVDCSLGAIHGVAGWTFENATFRSNNCTGLNVGPDNKVIGGRFNDNGHAGIQGYKSHRTVIDGAEIARNNTRRDNPENDAAGVKFVSSNLLTMKNNYVHDNYGIGLWCDLSCSNVLIEGNTAVKNYGRGIYYEVSTGSTIIRNNVANDNNATFLTGGPQIAVFSSNGVEVYGNNVRASGVAGSILMQADGIRSSQLELANNYFHNNVVTITSDSSRTGFANYYGGSIGTGNWSNNNAFYVLNTSHSHFYWNTSSGANWTTYRSASGQDAGSTIQVGNASVPGNTQGCPALTGCGSVAASVDSLTLINADTDKDIGPITNGATIDLGTLPTRNLNVRADTSPATVGSVVFTGEVTRTESLFPYALAGDYSGVYNTWTPSPGPLTITATPYSSSGGNGTEGQALTVTVTVK